MRIDAHAHIEPPGRSELNGDPWGRDRLLIDAADALEIDWLCCSCLAPRRPSLPEDFVACNSHLQHAIEAFPGRILGYAYVNPGYQREAVAEIERCVREFGFIGAKLYNEYKFTDPAVRPVIEKCIELDVLILHHAGHTWWPLPGQPNISDAGDFAQVVAEYPELKLICGHIAGGGDWEWTIKALREEPRLFADTSGSVVDEGMIEKAVALMGADRLLFACDMSMTAGVGKILGADITEEQRDAIFSGNIRRLLGGRI
ncbi:MAG: amidohydrolase family protein [Armatimonadetes bacterium]|nr:amidohydrolase family protein [Armatimonadota bacterium]